MPEIGEVARIVYYLHKHLVGRTLAVVKAQEDANVFGKVGTSAGEFEKALKGKKVVGARQQGKYFWLVMSSPPHPLFHFGMAGWWKIRNEDTAYYKPDKKCDDEDWPPKYWKFALGTAEEPKSEHAFVDFRRFARIRLVDCAAEEMRKNSPLKENGPDPVQDGIAEEWLVQRLQSKHVPVKALLLDQANISGIGNWVGDELLYDAKIHPEQYSNTLTASQMKQLHKSIMYVCTTAVELRAESDKFPETWLFKHRWGKGKKDNPQTLPNGEKIKFLTVGGRTSAIIPSVQKKTGTVAADVDGTDSVADEGNGDDEGKIKKGKRSTKKVKKESDEEDDKDTVADATDNGLLKGKKRGAVKEEQDDTKPKVDDPPPPKKQAKGKARVKAQVNGTSDVAEDTKPTKTPRMQKAAQPKASSKKQTEANGRRRSARVSNSIK